MTPLQAVLARLALLAEQSGENVSEPRLRFIAEKLLPYGAEKVCEALEKLLESSRRFPTVAEIREAMGEAEPTARDVGLHVATVLLQAVSRYGSLQPGNARGAEAIKQAIGESAWSVALKLGGWNSLCDMAGDNVTALRAQIRDLVECYTRTGQMDQTDVPMHLPAHSAALAAIPGSDSPRALPEAKREILEEKIKLLKSVRERTAAGEISDDEAFALIRAVEVQQAIKEDRAG